MVKSGNWCSNNCGMFGFIFVMYFALPLANFIAIFTDWNLGNTWTLDLIKDFASPDMDVDTAILATPWQNGGTDDANGDTPIAKWSINDINPV